LPELNDFPAIELVSTDAELSTFYLLVQQIELLTKLAAQSLVVPISLLPGFGILKDIENILFNERSRGLECLNESSQ